MSHPNSKQSRRRFLRNAVHSMAAASLATAAGAEELPPLVDLNAGDASAGGVEWRNRGLLGAFQRVGTPTVGEVGGVRAVRFDGKQDAYIGPRSVAAIEGNEARTIEVWVYNPTIDAAEETLVAWGKRGGPDTSDMSLNYGNSGAYGAVTHWASDMGWNSLPEPGQWHHLAYTYDGKMARIYDNGVERNNRPIRLNTAPGNTINIGAQNGANGKPQFLNEFDLTQQAGSVWIASVRVYAGALSRDAIRKRFQQDAARYKAVVPPPQFDMLEAGTETYQTSAFALTVLKSARVAQSLTARDSNFDFLPSDRMELRASDHFYHLGDVTFRVRIKDETWKSYSSADKRADISTGKLQLPMSSFEAGGLTARFAKDTLAVFGPDCPIAVERWWGAMGDDLVLRFKLANHTSQAVELGAFGVAMAFNNILSNRPLEEAHEKCAFADPYIGDEAGYVQVTRLNGKGPALLVLPEPGTSFEAYRPLRDDRTPCDVTNEGMYEWMVHSKAYAENEWKNAPAWNQPTSRMLPPGASVTYGFRFALSPDIRHIESTLLKQKRPIAVSVPGYVLPTDQIARLFVHPSTHLPGYVTSIRVEPFDALEVQPDAQLSLNGWEFYTVTGKRVGPCRLNIFYSDKTQQCVQYNVIAPETEQVRKLGAYHATKQWYDDPNDPFGRTNSFMPVNRETGKIVLQHSHVWMSGLSDEMGAGPSVAMAMKNLGQPDAGEIALLEKYVSTTLWGKLQNPDYGVKASLFYYEPKLQPGYYTIRSGWDKARGETTWRAYNYPHVACVYWSLYRLARNHEGLVKTRKWDWYLRQAYQTAMAMQTHCGRRPTDGLAQFGLMVGSVFVEILRDLQREGWKAEAATLEAYMRQRAEHWKSLRYPFGSEMPWDSTGQEEVYSWCRYFGFDDKAQVTVDAILGYMPTVPNWAYNGAARRYFDAPVNGTRWPDIGRMTNHYGSSLNAIPVLDNYRRNSEDFYSLRVGYAGMNQVIANIDANGHGSYGFDANPAVLQFDPYTADYGMAFYGYARNCGAYVIQHPVFGWLGLGCNLREENGRLHIAPRDAFRQRVFVAPLNLYLTLDSGTVESIVAHPAAKTVELTLAKATPATPAARLRIENTRNEKQNAPQWTPTANLKQERGAYVAPLTHAPMTIGLKVAANKRE